MLLPQATHGDRAAALAGIGGTFGALGCKNVVAVAVQVVPVSSTFSGIIKDG